MLVPVFDLNIALALIHSGIWPGTQILFECRCNMWWRPSGSTSNVNTDKCLGFRHTTHGFVRLKAVEVVPNYPKLR